MAEKKQGISEESKQAMLKMFEVSLLLDKYDDIFSSFDPRSFCERALSYDFLEASKRATRDKPSGQIELKLRVPKKKRKLADEKIIKKRFKEYFRYHHDLHLLHLKKIMTESIAFILAGIIFMFFASLLLFKYPNKTFFISFIIILLEPGGWFFFWEGLSQIIFDLRVKKTELDFFKKMSSCTVDFVGY